jgi:hypothetical protein
MTLLRKTFLNNSLILQRAIIALLLMCAGNGVIGFESTDPDLTSAFKKVAAEADSFDNVYDAEVWLVSKDPSVAKIINDKERRLDLLRLLH